MQNQHPSYHSEEIQIAIAAATVEDAIELWKAKDWQTYKARRDLLVSVIRGGIRLLPLTEN